MRVVTFVLASCLATGVAGLAAADPAATAPAAAPVAVPLVEIALGSMDRVHAAGDAWLASQPSAADLEIARDRGVRTVITLRHPDEVTDFDQGAVAESLGLAFVSLPWNGVDELSDEVLDRSRELLATAERPLLLTCGSGNRVGAVWLPYRVLDEGQPVAQALEEARAVGLKSAEYEARALAYAGARSVAR